MKFLITGAAGFIGAATCTKLCEAGHEVVGIDNLNDYYDVGLKQARLDCLASFENFHFMPMDIADRVAISELFKSTAFEKVVHLAAQAGVRYSLENPGAYIDSNITGTANILEGCRHSNVSHLIYASSSSVYGLNEKIPFSESDNVDAPASLYAATKKSNELMASSYSHLYGIRATGLRFFTVYGPWGRPDMAPFLFVDAIANGRPIKVFNHGKMQRDFTYIDDIVEGVCRISISDSSPNPDSSLHNIYNIGNNDPVELEHFIACIEESLNKEAVKQYMPMQNGDVVRTYADISKLHRDYGFSPSTDIFTGVRNFVEWYKSYYRL